MPELSLRRFGYALVAFVAVLIAGTIGFHLVIGEGWVESFYRAVVSTTLTGLDTRPESTGGQLLTIVILLSGVAIFLYLAGAIVEAIARGVVTDVYGERKRRRTIEHLRDHTIICGFGRVGRNVAAELSASGAPFVVIDVNDEPIDAARSLGVLLVQGDGASGVDLERAGISRARALVASVDSDEKNVFIVLTVRSLRPDIHVIARASNDSSEAKLRMAGASHVVQPYSAAGLKMANLIVKPQVAAFLDIASTAGGPEMRFEEIEVLDTCASCGRSIRELAIRESTGAAVIAIRKSDGMFTTNPPPETRLVAGDIVIGVGTTSDIRKLEELFAPEGVHAV